MQYDAALIKLRAIASYVKVKAAATAQGLNAEAQYVLLKAAALTGYFLKFVNLDDVANLSDAQTKALGKSFGDLADSADTLRISSGKALADSAQAAEQAIKALNKGLAEIQAAADVITNREFGKALSDAGIAAEDLSFNYGKPLADTAVPADVFLREIEYLRAFLDEAINTDVSSKSMLKSVSEIQSASDEFSRSLAKQLIDTARPTDDLDGEATTEDDQLISFTKLRSESVSAADELVRAIEYFRSLVDSAVANDVSAREFIKAISDAVSVTDETQLSRTDIQNNEDAASTFDDLLYALSKSFTEAASSSDAAFKEFMRSVTESVGNSDEHAKDVNKAAVDAALTTDSGSLISQGYCDLTYFAEDYVGSRITF